MLRNVAIDNFIKFRKRQNLIFHEGANYIIGGNCTGKSSIFELIRRCLSLKESTSMSSIPDPNQPAYVLCKFDLPENKIDLGDFDSTPPNVLYSSIFVTESNNGQKKMYKVVCICSEESSEPYADVWMLNDKLSSQLHSNTRESCQLTDNNAKTKILNCLKRINEGNKDVKQATVALFGLLTTLHTRKEDSTRCETILEKLTETFAVTFPLRAIGPLQWNKSKKIAMEKREGNYKEAAKKAEILNALVDSEDVDSELEASFFSTLTHPLKYNFKKGEDGLVECNNNVLLKTPEGILEAKQFSLILAHRKYLTVCLEEPDHGMHPQMIEKMRNLVLRTYKDKVIIFTSHHPSMIGTWTLDRTHVCRRNEHQDEHNIIKVVQESKALLQGEMRNFLFANAVLFVEGRDDNFVLSLLFDKVLGSTPDDMTENDLTSLRGVISGIQILNLNGYSSYTNYSTLAKDMQVPCMFLFDKDVPYDVENKPKHRNLYRNKLMVIWKENNMDKRKEIISNAISGNELLKPLEMFRTEEITIQNVKEHLKDHTFQKTKETDKRMETVFGLDRVQDETIEKVITRFKSINVFFWRSGDLEDMICESILQSEMEERDKKDLLIDLFLLEGDSKSIKKKKSSLPFLNEDNALMLSRCLLKSEEIERFFAFLTDAVPSSRY